MKVQWGGGILESKRKSPKNLQRFTKNKKQKRIIIGSIIGILLVIGGFTLYKTFALYQEEQSFDVLQGTVPYFVYGDVKLAIKVDGEQQAKIPEKREEYVVDPKCDHDATIEWDYENWGPIIKNITKETRCSLNFITNNNLQTLGKLLGIENLSSIETLLTNGNIDKLVASKEGMTYLAKSATLVGQLQDNEGYNDTIRKKILNSDIISEDLKYEAGLPCYLLKNNKVLKAAGDIILKVAYSGAIGTIKFSNDYSISVSNSYNSGALRSVNAIDRRKYTKLEMNYKCKTDDTNNKLTGIVHFGMYSINGDNIYSYSNLVGNLEMKETIESNNDTFQTTTTTANINDNNNDLYFWLVVRHNDEITYNTVYVQLNSIALY